MPRPDPREIIGSVPSPEVMEQRFAEFTPPLSETHQESIRRLVAYAANAGLTSFGALGAKVGIDPATCSKLLRAKYHSNPAQLCCKFDQFLQLEDRREELGEEPRVELSVTRMIRSFLDNVREANTTGLVWGESHVGKTEALKAYASGDFEEPRPNTYLIRMPAGAAAGHTLRALMKAMRVSANMTTYEMKEIAFRRLNRNSLLIVDEFHQVKPGGGLKVVTCEHIRELHDETKCGLALCWTIEDPSLKLDDFFTGRLTQFKRRGTHLLEIPRAPKVADLTRLRKAYGFPDLPLKSEAYEEFMRAATRDGIGRLCKLMREAKKLSKHRPDGLPSWEDFRAKVATDRVCARGEWKEAV